MSEQPSEKFPDGSGIPPDVRMESDYASEQNNPTAGEEVAFGLSKFLDSVDYPATKEDLIDYAMDAGVETVALDMLEQLPDTTYNSPSDVSQALGENSNIVT